MKNNINLIDILNLIKKIGFLSKSLMPDKFFYKNYEFEITYNFNDEKPLIYLWVLNSQYCLLEEEFDLNIIYNVLCNEFKSELRKIKIGKLINESN